MDTLRGNFTESGGRDDHIGYDAGDEDYVRELPPAAIGQDERRMQVRAYNYWASLLGERNFPLIEDLEPQDLPDFGPFSVLLDFSAGIENPAVQFLGPELAKECGADGPIQHLADVPARSLLSRITDHYLQIIANQAPIGFEAEFVNQRGATILYRGILLPFSSDDDTIDFIYGVINWKELADQQTTDELLLEIDQALEAAPASVREESPLAEWADAPVDPSGVFDLVTAFEPAEEAATWPEPGFGTEAPLEVSDVAEDGWQESASAGTGSAFKDQAEMALADWLASARELAQQARVSDDRSRQALYAAIGRAYDFSLAAAADAAGFAELVADAGLSIQNRAPMTPVVKLVFGADYDKTRLTEYAAALGHAHYNGIKQGALSAYLATALGGLKGVVNQERHRRRGEEVAVVTPRQTPRSGILRKLRKLEHRPITEIAAEGSEFALLIARRLPSGEVVLIGEVSADVALFEKAARKLIV